jgi:Mg-chelatase subunit ChlI
MERHLAYEDNPEAFREEWLPKEKELSQQIKQGRALLPDVEYTSKNLVDIARLSASLHVDGHRADLVILKTARAHAAFEGRTAITGRDIALAAELAYPHRLKKGPFQQSDISAEDFQEQIDQLKGASLQSEEDSRTEGESEGRERPETGGEKADDKKKA